MVRILQRFNCFLKRVYLSTKLMFGRYVDNLDGGQWQNNENQNFHNNSYENKDVSNFYFANEKNKKLFRGERELWINPIYGKL